jgi:predicted transcriptional regulator
LQARVLHVLARRGPSTVREVTDEIQKRQALAYTTVMTVLGALHRKGIVTRAKQGKGYVYEARYTEADLRDRIAQHLTRELVDDFGDVALAHFATALDSIDRRRLEKLLRKAE